MYHRNLFLRPRKRKSSYRFSLRRRGTQRISRSEKIMSHPQYNVERIQITPLPHPLELDLLTYIRLPDMYLLIVANCGTAGRRKDSSRKCNLKEDDRERARFTIYRQRKHGSLISFVHASYLSFFFSSSTLSRQCSWMEVSLESEEYAIIGLICST